MINFPSFYWKMYSFLTFVIVDPPSSGELEFVYRGEQDTVLYLAGLGWNFRDARVKIHYFKIHLLKAEVLQPEWTKSSEDRLDMMPAQHVSRNRRVGDEARARETRSVKVQLSHLS